MLAARERAGCVRAGGALRCGARQPGPARSPGAVSGALLQRWLQAGAGIPSQLGFPRESRGPRAGMAVLLLARPQRRGGRVTAGPRVLGAAGGRDAVGLGWRGGVGRWGPAPRRSPHRRWGASPRPSQPRPWLRSPMSSSLAAADARPPPSPTAAWGRSPCRACCALRTVPLPATTPCVTPWPSRGTPLTHGTPRHHPVPHSTPLPHRCPSCSGPGATVACTSVHRSMRGVAWGSGMRPAPAPLTSRPGRGGRGPAGLQPAEPGHGGGRLVAGGGGQPGGQPPRAQPPAHLPTAPRPRPPPQVHLDAQNQGRECLLACGGGGRWDELCLGSA